MRVFPTCKLCSRSTPLGTLSPRTIKEVSLISLLYVCFSFLFLFFVFLCVDFLSANSNEFDTGGGGFRLS